MSPARTWTLRFVGVGTFLVLWEIAGRILGDALFAPLSSVIVTYPELVEEYDLFRELATSMRQLAYRGQHGATCSSSRREERRWPRPGA